jgi:hypothetical protein
LWHGPGLENASFAAHIRVVVLLNVSQGRGRLMASAFIKIAILAVLVMVTLGVFPDRRRGGIIAIATCIAAAFVLHFVAP